MSDAPTFAAFASRDEAADHVAALLEGALRNEIGSGTTLTTLLVSGGSTPGPVFERLSQADLDWSEVSVGLVDERWVDEEDPRSNAGLVKRTLLTGKAQAARFLPMKTRHPSAGEAVRAVDDLYLPHFSLRPIILLGMGPDGHTASWFPGAQGLEAAMAVDQDPYVAAIDATGAPVAGDMPHRMTLTGQAIATAGFAILYITGEEKRAVLEDRAANLPIHYAERILGSRLKEVWAP